MIYLLEVVGLDSSAVPTTYRFATQGYCSTPADTPANAYFDGRLLQPGLIKRGLFSSNQTTGPMQISYGTIELANGDGALDGMLDQAFDGQDMAISAVGDGAALSTALRVQSATLAQPTFTSQSITLLMRDLLYRFDVALQPTKYLGNNILPNGAEGVSTDLLGKPKPRLYGKALNITPIQVNTALLTYQVHDGTVSSIAVYDRGMPITDGGDVSNLAALEAATPAAGYFITCRSLGLFRLGATPTGQVTADVAQTSSAANHTAAQIIKSIALAYGVTSVSSADVTALDTAQPAELGLWIDAEAKPLDVINQVKEGVGAYVYIDYTGTLRMGQLNPPSGTPVVELTPRNNISVDVVASGDTERGIPCWRVNLTYAVNHTVQTPTDLAGGVAQARVNELGKANLQVSAEDVSVKTRWPLAPEMNRTSLLTDSTAASSEASRLLGIYKELRQFFNVEARLEDITQLELGQVVRVVHPRFGLSAGKLLRVLGIQPDYAHGQVSLTLWG